MSPIKVVRTVVILLFAGSVVLSQFARSRNGSSVLISNPEKNDTMNKALSTFLMIECSREETTIHFRTDSASLFTKENEALRKVVLGKCSRIMTDEYRRLVFNCDECGDPMNAPVELIAITTFGNYSMPFTCTSAMNDSSEMDNIKIRRIHSNSSLEPNAMIRFNEDLIIENVPRETSCLLLETDGKNRADILEFNSTNVSTHSKEEQRIIEYLKGSSTDSTFKVRVNTKNIVFVKNARLTELQLIFKNEEMQESNIIKLIVSLPEEEPSNNDDSLIWMFAGIGMGVVVVAALLLGGVIWRWTVLKRRKTQPREAKAHLSQLPARHPADSEKEEDQCYSYLRLAELRPGWGLGPYAASQKLDWDESTGRWRVVSVKY